MAQSVTFIHSADIHLGAPFRGLRSLSDTWAHRLVDAIPQAFDRLISTCIKEQVDFLLLAGDIFDTDTVSYAHYRRFIDGLWRLDDAEIPVYLCAGNHDPFASWSHVIDELPPCAHLFPSDKPDFMVYEKHGEPLVLIGARGFSNQPVHDDIALGITRDRAEQTCGIHTPFAIGMLHTGFTIDKRKAPCKEQTLRSADLDYWAFGHIHQPLLFPEKHPLFAYSGCVQGRDIKETGPRGCLKVTLTENALNEVEFIPLASVEWEQLSVDVEGYTSLMAVRNACINAMFDKNRESQCEEMVVRLTLKGKAPIHQLLCIPSQLEELRASINENVPTFYCDALIDETVSPRDTEALRNQGLFPTAVFEAADHMLENADKEIQSLESEFIKRSIGLPNHIGRQYDDLVEQARDTVLDMLGDGARE